MGTSQPFLVVLWFPTTCRIHCHFVVVARMQMWMVFSHALLPIPIRLVLNPSIATLFAL